MKLPDGFEGQGLQAPRLEFMVVVIRTFRMDHQAVAKLASMLVKGGLEPALTKFASPQPRWR